MTLRVVVIGLGKQAQEDHLPALKESAEFELVGVCDTDPDKVSRVGGEYNVFATTELHELLEKKEFEVAVVAVPHHCYVDIIRSLALAGKHIIKEKPFATNINEAREIIRILKDSNVYLGTMTPRRFNPIYRTFHQLRKRIGKIYSIEGEYTMNVLALDAGWRSSKKLSGGGALVDMGYHFVDLLIWYFGVPTSVTARMTRGNRPGQQYDVEDTIHLLFDYNLEDHYDEKLVGNFVISRVYPEKQERIQVFGTEGSIEVSRGLIRRLDIQGKEVERLERKGGWPSAAVEQLDFFAERIKGFVPGSLPDYTEHLQHIAVIEAAYQSDRSSGSCPPSDFLDQLREASKEDI